MFFQPPKGFLVKLTSLGFTLFALGITAYYTSNKTKKVSLINQAAPSLACQICFGVECIATNNPGCLKDKDECATNADCGWQNPVENSAYSCSNFRCLPDQTGIYSSLSDCMVNCDPQQSTTKYRCDTSSYSCLSDSNGIYPSYKNCLDACDQTNPLTNQTLPCSYCLLSSDCPINSSCSNSGCIFGYTQTDSRWANNKYHGSFFITAGCGPTAISNLISSFTPVQINPWEVETQLLAGSDADGLYSIHTLFPVLEERGFKISQDRSSWKTFGEIIRDTPGVLGWLNVNVTIGEGIDHHTLLTQVVKDVWYLQDPYFGRLACNLGRFDAKCRTTQGNYFNIKLLAKWFVIPPTARWCSSQL